MTLKRWFTLLLLLSLVLPVYAGQAPDPSLRPPRPALASRTAKSHTVPSDPQRDDLDFVRWHLTIGRNPSFLRTLSFGAAAEPAARAAQIRPLIQGSMVWKVETVDHEGDVGQYPSLAFDADGYLNAVYYDATNGDLRYAYRDQDGSGWHAWTMDGAAEDVGMYASLAMDSHAWPHAAYYGADEGALWYSYWDGSAWQREWVDGGNVGEYPSLALDSDDHAHISYYDAANHDLKYAYRKGPHDWQIETVDGGSPWVGWYSSLELDSSDLPHIAYYDASNGDLLYAYHDGASWQFESVDWGSTLGIECSLALDGNDRPHISYWDWGDNEDLKYAHRDNSGWQVEAVDRQVNVGRYSAIAVDPWGFPHISYHDWDNQDLKYATKIGSEWHIETAASLGSVGIDTTIVVDTDGYPYIGYYDGTAGDLRVAIGRASSALDEVPTELYRRAAQHLQDNRHSAIAPDWAKADLGADVQALYRPDVEGIAYYEFPVWAPGGVRAGFIVLSADDHDYGVAHWSPTGSPPTQRLAEMAQQASKTASRFFKLDALAYAAENSAGEIVATLGDLPPKMVGFDPDWLETPGYERTAQWTPNQPISDDSQAAGSSGTLSITGSAPPAALRLESWASWDELKNKYAGTYKPHLDQLDEEANADWSTERTINDYGRVLYQGDSYDMAMLYAHGTARFSGEGKDDIQYRVIEREGLLPLLNITVVATPPEPQRFTVKVEYGNGIHEIANFLIGVRHQVFLPLSLNDSSATSTVQVQDSSGATPSSAPLRPAQNPWVAQWTFAAPNRWDFQAAIVDQRWYGQLKPGQWPNTSGCASGCGATAWAMLFGWADYRASLHDPNWAHRWGIYRQGGGWGLDAMAPTNMHSDQPEAAGIKGMIWDIRTKIGTFCILGDGATAPWDMGQAANYLAGRTGARLSARGSVVGRTQATYRDAAIWAIQARGAPAIVTSGWFIGGHYPVAFGYSWNYQIKCNWLGICTMEDDYQFLVNQGWGYESGPWWHWTWGIIPARTWFVGEIMP